VEKEYKFKRYGWWYIWVHVKMFGHQRVEYKSKENFEKKMQGNRILSLKPEKSDQVFFEK